MSLLKKNIAANFAGDLWQAVMGLVFIPLYIRFMGIEAYGLIGIFATMQALFAMLDMGLGVTINREMARLSVLPGKAQQMRDLVRSLEIIYWCVAALIGVTVVILAPHVAYSWVKPGRLPPEMIARALSIMGFAMALQWPVSLYSGGLIGLQRQVPLNLVKMGVGLFRGAGAVLVLWLVSPTINAFFAWQIVVSGTNVLLAAFLLWRYLPASPEKATVQGQLLRGIWRFAAGMSGISVLATMLTQADKIILSRMLPLEMFGYYTLASVVAMTLYRFIGPVFSGVYPRLTQLVSMNDQEGLKRLYHLSCQFMSVLILPAAVVVAFFSRELLLLWTQDPAAAEKAHLLVSIFVIGTALNGLMNLPYALQLAHGWTRLTIYVNLVSVIVVVPLVIFLARSYGALGGAIGWVILNSGYVLVAVQVMHRRLLPTEKWRWYREDVGTPLVVAILVAGTGRFLIGDGTMAQPMMILILLVISIFTFVMTAIAAPIMRMRIIDRLGKWKVLYGNQQM